MTSFWKRPAAIAIVPTLVAGAVAISPVAASTPHIANHNVAMMSATTIMLDGTYAFGVEGDMDDKLQGDLCASPYDCFEARYNNWVLAPVSAGVRALDSAVLTVQGNKVVFGYSRGAAAAHEWIDAHANDPSAPSAKQLEFVFIGNPYRKYGGTQADKGQQLTTGAYNVLDISAEYDSVSDVPGKRQGTWFARMLARKNAKLSQHLSYDDVDLSRSDLLVYVEENPGGGTTTYVLVPAENLPIVDGIRWWAPKLADKLQEKWKPLIDSTYDRSMFKPAGPGGVQLPFADEKSTTVEVTTDETISSYSSSRTRSTPQNDAPESDPGLSVEDQFSTNNSAQTNSSAKRKLEQELDTEPKSDQEPNLSNEAEEEANLSEDLESTLDDDASNEEPSNTSITDDDANENENGSLPSAGDDNGSTGPSDSPNED
jgi:hypothetical protein